MLTSKMSKLYNFADDNTISTVSKNMSNLIQTLEKNRKQHLNGLIKIKW